MADFPVIMIIRYGCVALCNWLSEMEGETPCYDLSSWAWTNSLDGGYRLPTEAEWERAAAWDSDADRHWRYGQSSDNHFLRKRKL